MTTDTSQRSTNGSSSSSPARLGEAASGIADSAGQAAQTQASVAMNRAGETLEQVAQAIRDTGNQLRQERPEFAGIAETGAQRIDDLSMYLRQHDARDILDDAERFARRQPALVLGGGLVVGLVVGRLLRSGAEPQIGEGRRWQGGDGPRTAWTGSGTSRAWAGTSSTPGSGYGSSYGTDYGSGYAGAATGGAAGTTGSARNASSATRRGSATRGTAGTADDRAYTDPVADQTGMGATGSTSGSRRSTSTTSGTGASSETNRRKTGSSGS